MNVIQIFYGVARDFLGIINLVMINGIDIANGFNQYFEIKFQNI